MENNCRLYVIKFREESIIKIGRTTRQCRIQEIKNEYKEMEIDLSESFLVTAKVDRDIKELEKQLLRDTKHFKIKDVKFHKLNGYTELRRAEILIFIMNAINLESIKFPEKEIRILKEIREPNTIPITAVGEEAVQVGKNMGEDAEKIQVPNKLIMNKEILHGAFALYVEMKKYWNNNKANIYIPVIMKKMSINDTRTFKKYYNSLYKFGYIKEEMKRVPTTMLGVHFTPIQEEEGYTQVDVVTLKRIKEVTLHTNIGGKDRDTYSIGLRLFYYYEKNYNLSYGRAFPTYEQIKKDIKIHSLYIKGINTLFHNSKLVEVEIGGWYEKEIEGIVFTQREGNKYIPLCIR